MVRLNVSQPLMKSYDFMPVAQTIWHLWLLIFVSVILTNCSRDTYKSVLKIQYTYISHKQCFRICTHMINKGEKAHSWPTWCHTPTHHNCNIHCHRMLKFTLKEVIFHLKQTMILEFTEISCIQFSHKIINTQQNTKKQMLLYTA